MAVDDLYIPDGVFLKCDQGAVLTILNVTPKKHKLYGMVIATEKDNIPITNIPSFGACSSSGSACIPKSPQWKKVHEGGTKVEGQKPLLETSFCKCMQGGSIDIFFNEKEAMASLEADKKSRVDKIPWLDSDLGESLIGPASSIYKLTGGDPSNIGRGVRKGLKGTWNFISDDMWKAETWKGIGKTIATGVVGYMPPPVSEFPTAYEIEMQQQWMNTTAEERIASFDKDMGTDLTSTHEGLKKAASDFYNKKIENGTWAEGEVMAGEAMEFALELVAGSKGTGALVKGVKGSAAFASASEKLSKAITTINEFVKASKLGKLAKSIKGIFKVGRRLKIRGVTFDDFLASCKFPTDELANKAWDLFCKEDWKGLEKLFNDNKLNGGWPPNGGFINTSKRILKPGDIIDRYGGRIENGKFTDTGKYFGIDGASFESRALQESAKNGFYNKYEIIKELPVVEGKAIPWFGKEGMGTQFLTGEGVDDLIKNGYIKKIN